MLDPLIMDPNARPTPLESGARVLQAGPSSLALGSCKLQSPSMPPPTVQSTVKALTVYSIRTIVQSTVNSLTVNSIPHYSETLINFSYN
jgi:hypothetical protein